MICGGVASPLGEFPEWGGSVDGSCVGFLLIVRHARHSSTTDVVFCAHFYEAPERCWLMCSLAFEQRPHPAKTPSDGLGPAGLRFPAARRELASRSAR